MFKKIDKFCVLISNIDKSINIGRSNWFYMSFALKSSWYLIPTIEVCDRFVGFHFLCFFIRTD